MAVGGGGGGGVRVTVVNRHNLKAEFQLLRACLATGSYVAVDTEFPGTVHKPAKKLPNSRGLYFGPQFPSSPPVPTPDDSYDCMRKNVNDTKLIQLGLTVCDNTMEKLAVWEFNFNEFDDKKDPSDPASIKLLKSHGIDFAGNRKDGISPAEFAQEFLNSGLANPHMNLKWVFYHCTYDVGYLIKNLTQKPLPGSVNEFMSVMHVYLGKNVFDLKKMAQLGTPSASGLDKLAQSLGIHRMVGRSHQAGSDSLLTFHCFKEVVLSVLALNGRPVFPGDVEAFLQPWTYCLHGLPSLPLHQYGYGGAYVDQFYYPQQQVQVLQEHPQFYSVVPCLPSLVTQ